MEKHSLILSLSGGNTKAFDAFYNLFYKQVFSYTYYLLKDTAECREVVSNIFFSVWTYRSSLPQVQSIDAYLYTIARNECKKHLSNRNRYDDISLDEAPMQLEIADQDTPEDQLLTEELEAVIADIISTLPEKCRVIFMMSRNEGLKNSEIAERLSLSESTVRVQIKLAIEKLTVRVKEVFPHLTFLFILSLLFS